MRAVWIVALALSPAGALAAEPDAPRMLGGGGSEQRSEGLRRTLRTLGLIDELNELRKKERDARLRAERERLADVEGCALPPAEWDGMGSLTLSTEPASAIRAGDVDLGETPASRISLPFGCYTLRLTSLVDDRETEVRVRIGPGSMHNRYLLRLGNRQAASGPPPMLVASAEAPQTAPRRRDSHR